MLYKKVGIFGLLLMLILKTAVFSAYKFRLKAFTCTSLDKKFCNFDICSFKPVKPGVTEINFYVSLLQKPVNDTMIRIKIEKSGYTNTLIDIVFDGCHFLRNRRRNPMVQTLYDFSGFQNFSNMNHTCPFDHDLILKDYRLESRTHNYGNFLPVGRYKCTVWFNVYAKMRAVLKAIFEIYT